MADDDRANGHERLSHEACPVCAGPLVEDAEGVVYCDADSDHYRTDTNEEPARPSGQRCRECVRGEHCMGEDDECGCRACVPGARATETGQEPDPRFLGGETAVLTDSASMAFVVAMGWDGAVDMTANIDKPQMAKMLRQIADHLDPEPPCSCGGSGWVEDENWQGEFRGQVRVRRNGIIPCGFCNEGGERG